MKKTATFILTALSSLTLFSVWAQPANDNVCAAQPLTIGSTVTGNGVMATVEPFEVSPPNTGFDCYTDWCDGTLDNSVWYSFVAPASGIITLTTCNAGNNADTQLALYESSDCSDYTLFTLVAANDDMPNGCNNGMSTYASEISVCDLTPGNTYYVQVDGYMGEDYDFELSISTATTCPNIAYVQFVHSSGDQSIETFDIRVDGVLVADDLSYQEATDFILFENIANPYITINPSNSTDDSNPYTGTNVTLDQNGRYVVPIIGIFDEPSYNMNVNFPYLGFVGADVLDAPVDANNMQIAFFNNVTDIEAFRYFYDGIDAYGPVYYGQPMVDEYSLSSLPFDLYAATNPTHYATFDIPFENYVGESIAVITSGFVTPSENSNGPGLSMCVVHTDGTVDCFEDVLSVSELAFELGVDLYPNPANEMVTIKYNLPKDYSDVSVEILSITGQNLSTELLKNSGETQQEHQLSISDLPSGTYWVRLTSENSESVPEKLVVVH